MGSEKKRSKTWVDLFAGGSAGLVARILSAPFDVIKIRFQVQHHENRQYRSIFHAVRKISRDEGVFSLWKGNLSATYLWISYTMIQFGVYEKMKFASEEYCSRNNIPENSAIRSIFRFASGSLTAIISTATTYPFDLSRTQFAIQGNSGSFPSIISFAKHIHLNHGIRGFYSGMMPSILSVAPMMGINFAIYESLNPFLLRLSMSANGEQSNLVMTLISSLSGGLAGGLAKVMTYPLDTIKKRMQLQVIKETSEFSLTSGHSTILSCVKEVLAKEGLMGFYKGIIPSSLKSLVSFAIVFGTYDSIKRALGK